MNQTNGVLFLDSAHLDLIRIQLHANRKPQLRKCGREGSAVSIALLSRHRIGSTARTSCLPRGARCILASVTERANELRDERREMSRPMDLVQGTLDLLILKILALEPLHGWAISQRLKQVSGDVLQVSDGSFYPALNKLERGGWIKAEWKPSENNRRAKFYTLTRLGRKHLEKETASWNRLSAAITQVVQLKEA